MATHLETTVNDFSDLLAREGTDFVGRAYLLMLGRPADPEGLRNYGDHLRAGKSKLAILAALYASDEGQAYSGRAPEFLQILVQLSVMRTEGREMSNAREDGLYPVASDIHELLAHDDVDFIDCAYKTLLGRAPDAVGIVGYLQLLRSGSSKMRIVSSLHLSGEGRQRAVKLRGLKRAIIGYGLARSRLTGWLFRPLAQVEGETPIERRLRTIENIVLRMSVERDRETRELDAASADVTRLLQALADRRSV